MIDLFSRSSTAVVIRRKESGVIVDKFMENWVAIYGALEIGLSTDDGLKFNKTFQEMAEKLNLSLKTIAAYSPWSNAIVECDNAILTEIIKKVKETATSWTVNAKNSLVNVHGFSPYQIVYSRNPNLPSNIIIQPPALENKTIDQVMKRHTRSKKSIFGCRIIRKTTKSTEKINDQKEENLNKGWGMKRTWQDYRKRQCSCDSKDTEALMFAYIKVDS